MRLHSRRAHLIHYSHHNLSTQAVFREGNAHQHIHASATGDRKQLDALPPPIRGPTEHFYLSSPLNALPSHFSARRLLISCLSGSTYEGKQVVEVVVRGSLSHTQNPQRVSSTPFIGRESCYSQDTLLPCWYWVHKMQTFSREFASNRVTFSNPLYCIYFLGILKCWWYQIERSWCFSWPTSEHSNQKRQQLEIKDKAVIN